MKVLAVADALIGPEVMASGLADVPALTTDLTIREWHHDRLVDLQEDNLAVEQRGPEAIRIPESIFDDVADYDVVVTQFCPISAQVIERATALKAIGVLRAGIENIDVAAAAARHVPVVNAPGRNANAVAEFAVGMILAETRNIARAHAEVRAGCWDRRFPNISDVRELSGSSVGLVGLGQIGDIVARLLTAFGAQVSYYDPFVDTDLYPRFADVGDLAAAVDILSLHARLTDATRHIVSADVIARMRPHSVLVNTARSGLVDEAALVSALLDHSIMGAAVDTFDIEPLPPDSPFLTMDNVTVTSHLAGTTSDAIRRTPRILAARLAEVLGG